MFIFALLAEKPPDEATLTLWHIGLLAQIDLCISVNGASGKLISPLPFHFHLMSFHIVNQN